LEDGHPDAYSYRAHTIRDRRRIFRTFAANNEPDLRSSVTQNDAFRRSFSGRAWLHGWPFGWLGTIEAIRARPRVELLRVRRAFIYVLVAFALTDCRYDYEALMGTKNAGTGGSSTGTGGDVAIGGHGGAGGSIGGAAAGGRGGGQGGSADARGGVGGDAAGASGQAGENGAAGAGGVAGSAGASGRGGTGDVAGSGGAGGATGAAGTAGIGGVAGAGVGGAGGTDTGSGGTGGGGGTTGTGGSGSDLVLWYKFDDGSGTIALDSSTAPGAPRNGTFSAVGTGSGAFSTTYQVGTGALSLNGTNSTNGANISIPASLNALGATTAVTIACWVNVTTDRAWGRVFDFNNSSTTGYMFLTTYQTQNTPNSVRFAITTTNNAAEQQISSTARLTTGAWHHLAVVLDVGATYVGTLYVDGAVAGTNPAMTFRPSSLGDTTNNWIGRSAFTADPYFAGLIDDFRVYNRALTASEITTLYTTIR
jgi:hypothetical protein